MRPVRVEAHGTSMARALGRSHRRPTGSGGRVERWSRRGVPSIAMTSLGSWRTVLVSAVAVVGLSGALAACSSSETPATPTDPVLAEGQQVYTRNCARCHGTAGQGGVGPRLADRVTGDFPDIADQEQFIADGKGSMPGFADRLTPEQIEAVARYTRESL
jgi:mono/diheme cytochrome c family protein